MKLVIRITKMTKIDVTEMIQMNLGKTIKVDSALLDPETGIVDVIVIPVKPVEYININISVNNHE